MKKKKKKKKKIEKKSNFNFLPSSFYENFGGYYTNIIKQKDIQKLEENIFFKRGNRVSDFTGWIYDSIIPKRDNTINFIEGKKTEKELFDKIDKSDSYFKSQYSGFLTNDWVLEFEDLSDRKKKSFQISNLIVNNEPLIGKPDIVYRNKNNNDRIIIEIKSTSYRTDIPLGGWFNLQCQLWAYSQIDEFKSSKNIFLMGDIRIRKYGYSNQKASNVRPKWRIKKHGELYLDHEEVRKFHEQCKMIFEMYGGEYHQQN